MEETALYLTATKTSEGGGDNLFDNHLFEKTLPHLLYIQRLLFQCKLHYGGHKAGLRGDSLNAVLQPTVLLDIRHSAQERMPLVLLCRRKDTGMSNWTPDVRFASMVSAKHVVV